MEFQEVVRRRRMVRDLSDEPLAPAVVDVILANAQRGPSSGFTQGFDFVVFHGPEELERFWAAVAEGLAGFVRSGQGARAPLIIVPVANPGAYVDNYLRRPQVGRSRAEDFPVPYWFTDTGCAAMLILLTAVDVGLGAFWFSVAPTSAGVPDFKSALGIPEELHPIGAIAIGHPDQGERDTSRETRDQAVARRRNPSSLVHRAGW